ncbi:MAG: (Fe-S)-binding protein [Gordonibacter sp.]|uniref:(Fe-S)-binding protein n=1 Tax=Gordonibacter sp. TaxID=1968902 RepID=UPI002FC8292F
MDTRAFEQQRPQKLSGEELAQIAQLGSPALDMIAAWANKHLTCSHCKRCTLRCEVLKEPALDMGLVEEGYLAIASLPLDEQVEATLRVAQERPELYHALRRCCFCGFCTATCQTHMLAPERMREWRQLFMRAGLMPPEDSRLVMVDDQWHIFSAYRAIYGIAYPEFVSLASAAEYGPGWVDTLFFPGCSLVSYAPDLTRKVGQWLTDNGIAWALSDDCCGSPLMSAGLFDQAEALRKRILDQIRAAGITRVVTVCPGCGEEFAELMGAEVDIVPLPELLLEKSRTAEAEGRPSGFTPLPAASVTFFDSCHDRFDSRHGASIRELVRRNLPEATFLEMDHRRKGTLCCGAGGAVAAYDGEVTERRVWRIIDEARDTGAETLVTTCPTCTYTVAQACLGAGPDRGIGNRHYLELLFGEEIAWPVVFDQLGSMWTGDYGPWLTSTFFS